MEDERRMRGGGGGRGHPGAPQADCLVCLVCFLSQTCVLCDLPLGDHLLALGVHQLAVFVLLQTLQDVPGVGLGAEPLVGQGKGKRGRGWSPRAVSRGWK